MTSMLTVLVAFHACCILAVQCLSVSTEAGEFVGLDGIWGGKTVHKFFGIPFAEPPVGDLRFAKPIPKAPFKEPFPATKLGKSCPQSEIFLKLFSFNADWQDIVLDEDCLTLNIYVPAGGEAKKAVMIFVHGGGFVAGSGTQYDGSKMAAFGDVIVVTVNYRLGLFGFFTTGDEIAPGNYGLMDQQLAFKWVQANIAPFGGDRNRVTIFGESAGGASVTWNMLIPSNDGLFHRGIAQSGTALAGWALPRSSTVKKYNEMFLYKVNCSHNDSWKVLDCLRKKRIEDLDMENVLGWPFAEELPGQAVGGPRADGEFIPFSPTSRIQDERMEDQALFRKVDFLIGVNKYEASPFLTGKLDEVCKARTNKSLFDGVPKAIFKEVASGLGVLDSEVVIEALWWLYGTVVNGNSADLMDPKLFLDFLSDCMFNAGTVECLRRRVTEPFAESGSTYMYHLLPLACKEHGGITDLFQPESWIDGAIHTDDLNFLFGNVTVEKLLHKFPKADVEMSDTMITYWTNFAKTGNPNLPSPVKYQWPQFVKDTEEFIEMDIKDEQVDLRTNSFYRHRFLSFWTDVIPLIQNSEKSDSVLESSRNKGATDDIVSTKDEL